MIGQATGPYTVDCVDLVGCAMTQPEYVPSASGDRVRLGEQLPPAERWIANRPAEISANGQPDGRRFGNIGPDQGFALGLANRFSDRLVVTDDEHVHDAIAGCLGVALKRAALFGRAPVIYDLEFAFTLWGFLGGAPTELVTSRRRYFDSASHHYWDQRDIADAVPDSTLRMKPDEVSARLVDWTSLVSVRP